MGISNPKVLYSVCVIEAAMIPVPSPDQLKWKGTITKRGVPKPTKPLLMEIDILWLPFLRRFEMFYSSKLHCNAGAHSHRRQMAIFTI